MTFQEKKTQTQKESNPKGFLSLNKNNRGGKVAIKSKKLKLNDLCNLKISALGPKGIGIDEYSYPYSIFVPNGCLGESVKAKIIKVNLKHLPSNPLGKQGLEERYAIAQVLEVIKKSTESVNSVVKPDENLTVNIEKLTSKGAGVVNLKDNFKLIIPNSKIGSDINVIVTRVKSNYGFAKMTDSNFVRSKSTNKKNFVEMKLMQGSKYTLNLPKIGKYFGKYGIVKLHGLVLFIKLSLGAKQGDKVRIKINKVNQKFAIANVIQINPTSLLKKRLLVQNNIREMIKNGMHLGEKAIKCNARMKNYVWLKKLGSKSEISPLSNKETSQNISTQNRPLIKKDRHIINLLKTRRCLNKALTQLSKYALKGRTFLFIGTKKPAAGLIARASLFSQTSFFVNTRWLGGMLTNWKTILKSISKIRPILKEKQKIVGDILDKRQILKVRLIKKALLLKRKSQLILTKGRFLIEQFKNPQTKAQILEKTKALSLKRQQLVENCYSLLSNRQILIAKRRELMIQSIILKEKGMKIIGGSKNLLNELMIYSKKLRELKYLLILSNQIKNLKNKARQENKEILNISYGKVKDLVKTSFGGSESSILPNPPKEILNLILVTMKNKYDSEGSFSTSELSNVVSKSTTNQKVLVGSKLISKFSRFGPYLKNLIKTYAKNITKIKSLLSNRSKMLAKIKLTLNESLALKTTLVTQLNKIKTKLIAERNIIRVVKTKLKYFASQKRLIKFLPRLRYLATPLFTNKITATVKILMKKIVDPKLKYPIDNIYDDKLGNNSKKIATARKKKWQRLEKYFGGIAQMTKMTKSQISKNVAIVVGQKEEMNGVRECQKLGIKMFNIVDTNCNPSFADHIIPANDDSRNSIKYILNKFLVRIRLAQKLRQKMTRNLKTNHSFPL